MPASTDTLRNSLRAFSISSDALRARAPAALFPVSCLSAFSANTAQAYRREVKGNQAEKKHHSAELGRGILDFFVFGKEGREWGNRFIRHPATHIAYSRDAGVHQPAF